MTTATERVAIVTGASQGLGLAIAEKFLQEGKRVALLSRSRHKLEEIAAKHSTQDASSHLMIFPMDVSDQQAIRESVDAVMARWGRIDILVNNAGIRTETAIEDITLEEWNQIMSVNLGGTFFYSQAVLPVMKEQRWGRIINMSSFGGQFGPLTSGAHYCASKAGQLALTKVFARALASYNITVNAVTPASVRTPEMDKIAPEALAKMVQTIPLGRVGEPEEVADLVSYLASDNGGFVTGATFDINGGRLMR